MPRARRPNPLVETEAPPARSWTVVVPGWHPYGLNKLLRMHWARRRLAIRADADVLAVHCRLAGVPRAAGKRRVRLGMVLAGNDRKRDDDNAWKSVLDGLVACGALADDGPDWVEKAPVEYRRAKGRATAITIEDV